MASFENQQKPADIVDTCPQCRQSLGDCVCHQNHTQSAQSRDSRPEDHTLTTFSELTGRSLKSTGIEEVLTTTFNKERRLPYEPTNQPERIGDRYKIEALIGVGGMGAVYRGRHETMGKTLAIKVLHEDAVANKKAVLRFDQEARAASTLAHPHLVSVYDYGVTDDGAPYLVMDYLDGISLGTIIRDEGRLEPTRALTIFIQIAEAIGHAHKKGVIHRDLKPSNVIITKTDREEDFVKIVDFGIAKLMTATGGAEENSLTQTGEIFGSPLYMSPEQCTGQKLDQRSDIYSLGCLMYETLSGRPPLQGANPVQTIMMHVQDDAPPLTGTLPTNVELPPGLASVVMRCLLKSADERYQSADALISDLEKVRDGGKLTRRGQVKRFLRSLVPKDRKGMLIRAAVFGLLLSLPLAGSFYLVDKLFPDPVKVLVDRGDQSMKEPIDPIEAETNYSKAIGLGLKRGISLERQSLLHDKLAYCFLRQAKAYQSNQDKEKSAMAKIWSAIFSDARTINIKRPVQQL